MSHTEASTYSVEEIAYMHNDWGDLPVDLLVTVLDELQIIKTLQKQYSRRKTAQIISLLVGQKETDATEAIERILSQRGNLPPAVKADLHKKAGMILRGLKG